MSQTSKSNGFIFNLSSQFAKTSQFKQNQGLQAVILIICYSCQLAAFAFPAQPYYDASFQILEIFFKTTAQTSEVLIMPLGVIIFILLMFLYISIFFFAFNSMYHQIKIPDIQEKRLKIVLTTLIDTLFWIPSSIYYININLSSSIIEIGYINILLYTVLQSATIYYYRDYAFHREGLYRNFSILEIVRQFLVLIIVLLQHFGVYTIQVWALLILSMGTVVDLLQSPYLYNRESYFYLLGQVALFDYSVLGLLSNYAPMSFNQHNVFLMWLMSFPILFTLAYEVQQQNWRKILFLMKTTNQKEFNIKKYCLYLETLSEFLQRAPKDMQIKILLLEMLKFHERNCQDVGCECREKIKNAPKDEYHQKDSMMSRTALLTIVDDQNPNGEESFIKKAQPQPDDIGRKVIKIAIKIHEACLPMQFMDGKVFDEKRVMLFIKHCFNYAIHAFQYNHNTLNLEIVTLKYITFMSSYKQNSPAALSRLKQIQGRNLTLSNFFSNICQVLETQLIDEIRVKHELKDMDDSKMHLDEIWRLEQSKDIVVSSIVLLLKKKMAMWENLNTGDTTNLDKFIHDVLGVSKQLEESRAAVARVMQGFDTTVQKQYTYYHKYQCFQALFFESDYKSAAMYQRKMEDAWTLSKASLRVGELGNYHWLQGDIATLEVSVSLLQGQVLKGITPRLMEFLGFTTVEEMNQQLKLVIQIIQSQQRGTLSNSTTQNISLTSLMPPFLSCSHGFYMQRFLQRGHSQYIQQPVETFACDSLGFLTPVHIHLNFNFKNMFDFTMLGALLKKQQEEDYIVFDEWGRILGVTKKLFRQIIVKGSLDEFNVLTNKGAYIQRSRKINKQEELKKTIVQKLVMDDKAALFKKTITTNFQNQQKTQTNFSYKAPKRSYIKPSDILIRFGSVQHFLPQLAKQMTTIISTNIFKQLQQQSQDQMDKILNKNTNNKETNIKNEFIQQKSFKQQLSFMPDRQKSLASGGGALQASMIDQNQYRNYVIQNFLTQDGLVIKNAPIVQDEKITLYIPKNYNELIDYYNDAGERFLDDREMDSRSYKRKNIQNKYSYLPQEQQCQNIFDAEFQDFIDNKVKRYYSKALLKEAIENTDSKTLETVRYKTMVNIDVGLGGINETDQFLYFVCKLSNMNLMTAKRKDVLKIHLRKERNQQFDIPELRQSLLLMQSQDSFGKQKSKSIVGSNFDFEQQKSSALIIEPPKKVFSYVTRIKKQRELQEQQQALNPNVISLKIPEIGGVRFEADQVKREEGPYLKLNETDSMPCKKVVDISFESSRDSYVDTPVVVVSNMKGSLQVPKLQKQQSIEEQYPITSPMMESQESQQPPKKLNIGFLKKMENAMQQNQQMIQSASSITSNPEKKKFVGVSFLQTFIQRLNLRKVSSAENDRVIESNADLGFREQSEESSRGDLDAQGSLREDNQTPSGSNSMKSNNFSRMDKDGEEEKLEQEDELNNIFEVMSQASNQQSVKSISAISLATNISIRCRKYMPEQAASLQILKLVLVVLNIAGIITLLVMTNQYFDKVKVGGIGQHIMDIFSQTCISLHAANSIQQMNIIPYPKDFIKSQVFYDAANQSYSSSYLSSVILLQSVQELQDSIKFPIDPETGFQESIIHTLDQFVTDLSILVNGLELVSQSISNPNLNQVNLRLYKDTIDSLIQIVVFRHDSFVEVAQQINQNNKKQKDLNLSLVVYLMVAFIVAHVLVIAMIVPFVKQINDLYTRVLLALSRVTLDESQDELKKLTLCQHLLETTDDNWVTANQVKLIFYNKAKDLDLNHKYKNQASQKGRYYFSLRLSDTSLTIWKDMIFYITISGLSIAYLVMASLTLRNQAAIFNPFIQQYNQGVVIGSHLSLFITKMSLTPERFIQVGTIQSQESLLNLQFNGGLSYLLQSMQGESEILQQFNQDSTIFLEDLNLQQNYQNSVMKLKVDTADFKNRLDVLQTLSDLTEINHIMKDNLCYYNQQDICVLPQQKDVFNTGLVGAINQLVKIFVDHQDMLLQDNTILINSNKTFWDQDLTLLQYYSSQQYQDLILYGNQIIYKSQQSLLNFMNDFFQQDKAQQVSQLNSLYLSIGIPLVLITVALAALEVYILRRKVKRIMFALTYLPTFKFQDKIVLSLIKSILKI